MRWKKRRHGNRRLILASAQVSPTEGRTLRQAQGRLWGTDHLLRGSLPRRLALQVTIFFALLLARFAQTMLARLVTIAKRHDSPRQPSYLIQGRGQRPVLGYVAPEGAFTSKCCLPSAEALGYPLPSRDAGLGCFWLAHRRLPKKAASDNCTTEAALRPESADITGLR